MCKLTVFWEGERGTRYTRWQLRRDSGTHKAVKKYLIEGNVVLRKRKMRKNEVGKRRILHVNFSLKLFLFPKEGCWKVWHWTKTLKVVLGSPCLFWYKCWTSYHWVKECFFYRVKTRAYSVLYFRYRYYTLQSVSLIQSYQEMWEVEPKSYMEKSWVCFKQGKAEMNLVTLVGFIRISENIAN